MRCYSSPVVSRYARFSFAKADVLPMECRTVLGSSTDWFRGASMRWRDGATAHDPVEPEREEAPVSATSSEAIPEPSQL